MREFIEERLRPARRPAVASAVALALMATLASQAIAAPSWLAPRTLSPDGYLATSARVAIDAAGTATAVWQELKIGASSSTVRWSSRPVGGEWQPVQTLASVGSDGGSAEIAADAAGNALAAWIDGTGPSPLLKTAFRPAAGSWQLPQTVDTGAATSPHVAVDALGNAVAVWERGGGIRAAARSASLGAWSSPQDLSVPMPDHTAGSPDVAIDPAGDAVALWNLRSSDEQLVQASVRPAAGGPWQASQDLSPHNYSAIDPRVSIDASGIALAVWSEKQQATGAPRVIRAASRPTGGPWQSAETISRSAAAALTPQVAIEPTGQAVAVWSTSDAGNTAFEYADRSPAGVWGAPGSILRGAQATFGELVVNPVGDAVATWSRSDGANPGMQAANRTAGGAWGASQTLSAAGQDATADDAAIDDAGNAVAIWQGSAGGSGVAVQAAAYGAGSDASSTIATTPPPPGTGPVAPRRDVIGPIVLIAVSKRASLRTLLAHGLKVPIGCSEACTLHVRLLITTARKRRLHLSSRVIASATRKLGAAGRTTVVLKLTRRIRARLRHTSKLNVEVRTLATDVVGNATSTSRALRLRR